MTALDGLPAVLWDMDGTLIDSESVWIDCQVHLARGYGGDWSTADGLELVGADMATTAAALQRRGVRLSAEDIIAMLDAAVLASLRTSILWRPGVPNLLESIAAAGWRSAIVTTSAMVLAEVVRQAAPAGSFGAVVAAGSTARPKPAPDPYWKAAELLETPISRCVAIEDSTTGLRSAIASGAVCIAVPNLTPLPVPPRGARWATLAGRTPEDLAALLATESRDGVH